MESLLENNLKNNSVYRAGLLLVKIPRECLGVKHRTFGYSVTKSGFVLEFVSLYSNIKYTIFRPMSQIELGAHISSVRDEFRALVDAVNDKLIKEVNCK